MQPSLLPRQVDKVVLRILEDLATPVSLKVAILLRYKEADQIANLRIDPRHYLDAESYWRDATAVSILRKYEPLPTSVDRAVVAEESFLACERQCHRTNRRIFPYLYSDQEQEPGVRAYIMRVRKIISSILGPAPDIVVGKFGPGATYGDRGRLTTIPDKMSSSPTLTSSALPWLFQWSGTAWASACALSGREVEFVRGNRFTTVPKDATKHRGIAIEPSLNVFYQLGYGGIIRHRLASAGIDLNQGQDIHRRVACEASIRGHLATLDLSNASDTICKNLVKLLLPSRWFHALDDLRSKRTWFRGSWHLLEKFSSMGNGFTFELETLIFLGLALGLDDGSKSLIPGVNVFAYGDDIILPSSVSNDMMSVLSFFGMTVNERKSFVDGPFRESCGGDFFLGTNVRPFFLKEEPCEPQQLISFANGLRLSAESSKIRSSCILRGWHSILDALPIAIRNLRGPKGLGDLLLHDDESRWLPSWRDGIRYFRTYGPVHRKVAWDHFRPEVTLASAVYGVPSGAEKASVGDTRPPWSSGGVIPRGAVAGYKLRWTPYS